MPEMKSCAVRGVIGPDQMCGEVIVGGQHCGFEGDCGHQRDGTTRVRLGFMYIARRPCGKVSATSWDEPGREKEIAKSVAEWIKRGDKVERIERFKDDPQPEWICRAGCQDCRKPTGGVA